MILAQVTVCGRRRVWSTLRAPAFHQRVKCSDPRRDASLAEAPDCSTTSENKAPREQWTSQREHQAPQQERVPSFLWDRATGQVTDRILQFDRVSRQAERHQ